METLRDICEKQGIHFGRVYTLVMFHGRTPEQAMYEVKNNIKDLSHRRYWYRGEPLWEYCKEHNLDYRYIVSTYNNRFSAKNRPVLTIEEIVDKLK